MKRRVKSTVRCCMALVLCLGLLLPAVGGISYAAPVEEDTSLCEHHPQHTEECAYREGENGTPCGYKCEICGSGVDSGGSSTEQVINTTETGTEEGSKEESNNGTESEPGSGEETEGVRGKVAEPSGNAAEPEPENGPGIGTGDVSGNGAADGTGEKELQSAGDVTAYSGGTGERLDGDYAYIYDAKVKETVTGIEKFDENDEPGNDSSKDNDIVRSFDKVTYTLSFQNRLRAGSPYQAYEEGVLHYEFILPVPEEKAQFNLESMGWVSTMEEAKYSITTYDHAGETWQVLRGSYLWTGNENNPSAIGQALQELNVSVQVLAMTQGETLQPKFTFWMDHNDVPTEGLVTESGHKCSVHGEEEFQTITSKEVKISSAPRFNVQIKAGYETQYVSSFDFSSGNTDAPNKNAGNVTGRVQAFGVTLQIAGKKDRGLLGCELPDGKPITFELKLSSGYRPNNSGSSTDVTEEYTPLLWSAEGNSTAAAQQDGRAISANNKYAFLAAPFNKYSSEDWGHYSCNDGGTWKSEQDGETIRVTVENYEAVFDLSRIPSTVARMDKGDDTYYNPNTAMVVQDIQQACFSAGEFWIVQPFYNSKTGKYIVDEKGTGSFTLEVTDVNLSAGGISGQTLKTVSDNSNQINLGDDRSTAQMELERPGEIGQYIRYSGTKISDEACHDNGKDWILTGDEIEISEQLAHLGAEGMNTAVAYDVLMKFDDAFFDITDAGQNVESSGIDNLKISYSYGAKPDRTGWDHGGKEPDQSGYDTDMMDATADDLIFFSDLKELEENGYVCVAVLMEARGLASEQSTEIYFTASGTAKKTSQTGHVYMVTHSGKGWSKKDVQEDAANKLGKNAGNLTNKDYIDYAKNYFPTRIDQNAGDTLKYSDDYPASFWTNDTEKNVGLKNYKKSTYGENGYEDGSTGRNFGDSCLVVDYATRIQKYTAQLTGNGSQRKTIYNLDSNQNVADYMLDLSAVRAAGEFPGGGNLETTVYVEDTLPAGLNYIPYSSYWGGEYRQKGEGKQGEIDISESGQALEPDVEENDDGTTTLRWTLEQVEITGKDVTEIAPIYYSCDIGGTKLQNSDQLLNTAKVWSDKEPKKDFTEINGNQSDQQIQVVKLTAISLSKTADQSLAEAGEEIGFTMNVGNNSSNSMQIIAMDSLPYTGDALGSDFNGDCVVTEFSITLLQELFLEGTLELYYSENTTERGNGSQFYKDEGFDTQNVWKKLDVNSEGEVTLPPGEFKPVAIAAKGELPAGETLKMHVTLKLPQGTSGDRVINRLTEGTLESYGRSYIVGRILEGVVWLDANENGLRESGETMQDGAKVTLMKLKENGNPNDEKDYEPYKIDSAEVTVESGKQFNLATGETTDYESGGYRFTNLPEGVFGVRFSEGTTVKLEDYKASPADQGEDDTIDSDAVPNYSGEDKLTSAFIPNIVMPSKDEITGAVYTSAHHDLGLYESAKPTDFTFKKVKAENQAEGLSGAEFKLFALNCEDQNHNENDHSALIDPDNMEGCWKLSGTDTSDPDVTFEGLLPGEYRLVETKAPAGRVLPSGQWKVVISEKLEITITGIGETKPPAFANGNEGALLLPNMLPADIPGSGGRGTAVFAILGIMFMGSGAAVYFTLRKRRGGNKY